MPNTDFDVLTPIPDDYDWDRHDTAAPRRRLAAAQPPVGLTAHEEGAKAYRPDPDLIVAVNAAIHLRAPLLLTGDPGTGKTQLAYFLGRWFGIQVFAYTVRSASTARDLRYDFDAVAYLREAYLAQAGRTDTAPDAEPNTEPRAGHPCGPGWSPCPDAAARDQRTDPRMAHVRYGPLWCAFTHAEQCIVLIDEIDKAPRDFPNDLLQELDKAEFPHPFGGPPVRADRARLPLLLVTSNNERRLPDAFLRRCVVHHIELTPDLMRRAVAAHGKEFQALAEPVRQAAIKRFQDLRTVEPLSRRPGIAELLAWLVALSRAEPGLSAAALEAAPLHALPQRHCLIKDHEDIRVLKEDRRRRT